MRKSGCAHPHSHSLTNPMVTSDPSTSAGSSSAPAEPSQGRTFSPALLLPSPKQPWHGPLYKASPARGETRAMKHGWYPVSRGKAHLGVQRAARESGHKGLLKVWKRECSQEQSAKPVSMPAVRT